MGRAKKGAGYTLAAQIGIDSGVKRLLETPLIINGAEGSTILRFDGAAASAAGWPEYGGAGILALQAGTAPAYGVPSPFGGVAGETGVVLNGGGYYSITGWTPFNTSDAVVEGVIVQSTKNNARIASTRPSGVGTAIYCYPPRISAYLCSAAGGITVEGPEIASGTVQYFLMVFDRSAYGVIYTWSNAGTAFSIAAQSATIDNTAGFAIGADPGGTNLFDSSILYLSIHSRASGWLDSHLQPTLVAKRIALLTGTKPLVSRASPVVTSLAAGGNAGAAYQERIVSSAQRLFYMGAGSPRFNQRADANGNVFTGALVEASAINVGRFSNTLASMDSPSGTTRAAGAATAPDGSTGFARVVETTGASAQRYLADTTGGATNVTANDVITAGVFVGAGDRYGYVGFISGDGPSCGVAINPADGSVGQWTGNASYFTAVNCGAISCGGGVWYVWGRFTAKKTEGVYRLLGLATGTTWVAAQYAGDSTANPLGALFWGGVWQVALTDFPSSPIITTTAVVTRAADTPHRYSGVGHFGPGQGSLKFRFLAPTFTPGRSHYLLTCYKAGATATDYITFWIDTSGYVNVASAASGGVAGLCQKATNCCNNVIHTVICSWQKNNLRLWVDGVAATPDTTCDFATDLDTVDVGADNTPGSNQAGPVLVEYPFINPRADKWG